MNERLNDLIGRIRELQEDLEAEFASGSAQFQFTLEDRKVRFAREVRVQHRRLRTGVLRYLAQSRLRNLASAPLIYGMAVPLLLLDLALTGYQWTCFPLYGIARVRRREHFVFDRHTLAYLNLIERFNCAYCSYATGLAAYLRAIVGLTEQYWCPIKHARRVADTHARYGRFVDFGDADAYRRELEPLRREVAPQGPAQRTVPTGPAD
jgi:hypothetical protein